MIRTNDTSINNDEPSLHDIADTMSAGAGEVASEVRAAADDLRDAGAEMADTAAKAASRGGQHARAAAGSAKVVLREAAEIAAQAAADAMDLARQGIRGWKDRGEDYVRTKPMQAIGVAAAAGVVLGIWMARRR